MKKLSFNHIEELKKTLLDQNSLNELRREHVIFSMQAPGGYETVQCAMTYDMMIFCS